jgi:hypothetical protein
MLPHPPAPFSRLSFIHIFSIKNLLWEGDPSSLQTCASSGLSEFGMTGLSWKQRGKKRRAANIPLFHLSRTLLRLVASFPLIVNQLPVIPSGSEGSPYLF